MTPRIHDYADALGALQGLGRFGVRLGLERMEQLLAGLGRPQQQLRAVHLAGTNGKGSTAAMLERCLRQAGIRVGLFTSPHLSRFTERIRVDGHEIERAQVVRLARRVLGQPEEVTFFEAVTAMALCHFAEQQVDLVVMETGLGGRLDATNVVQAECCVLTNIDLDHQEILGAGLEQIAAEKAGIIKSSRPVVCAPSSPPVQQVIARRCQEMGARHLLLGRDFSFTVASPRSADGSLERGTFVSADGWRVAGVELALKGAHQRENAALCLAALEQLRAAGVQVSAPDAVAGLRRVRWPGRLEWVADGVLVDGAHNPAGALALAASLPPPLPPLTLIVGVLGQRPLDQLVAPLAPLCGRVIVTRPRGERGADAERGAQLLRRALNRVAGRDDTPVLVAPRLEDALALARRHPEPVLVAGSLYLVAEARELLAGEVGDPVQTADPLDGKRRGVSPHE